METKTRIKEPVFLPVYFKKIGLVVSILACFSLVIAKSMDFEFTQTQKELFSVFTLNAFILGLQFVACSRDKVEDEMTVSIRLKAMFWTITMVVLYVIIMPLIDLLFKDPVGVLTGQQVIMGILFIYLFQYYLQKFSR